MHSIVAAIPDDIDLLANLEIRSESYWGYSESFMERFKKEYLITRDFIENNPTFILKEGKQVLGFYGLLIDKNSSLEFLFVEPEYIGKGYGKVLWNHALEECVRNGVTEFTIITSPEARGFYLRLGAYIFKEVDSLISEGNKTPILIYNL